MRSSYSASSPAKPSVLGDQSASAAAQKDDKVGGDDRKDEGEEDEQEEVQDPFQVEEGVKGSHEVVIPSQAGTWAQSIYTGVPAERNQATIDQQKQQWKDALNSGDVQKYNEYVADKRLPPLTRWRPRPQSMASCQRLKYHSRTWQGRCHHCSLTLPTWSLDQDRE